MLDQGVENLQRFLIGPEGGTHIGAALRENKTLAVLSLPCTGLNDAGASSAKRPLVDTGSVPSPTSFDIVVALSETLTDF